MQALQGTPETTPRGELWAFILVLTHTRGPLLYFCGLLGSSFRISMKTAIFPRLAHSSNFGPVLALWLPREARAVEVRHVGSQTTAADAVERRARLPEVLGNNMEDALARMSANSKECDEACSSIHRRATRLHSTIRNRSHLFNVAAHQVEPADRPPTKTTGWLETRTVAPGRPPTRSRRPTITSTASPAVPQSRKNGSTPGSRRRRVQRCSTSTPLGIGRSALHDSRTLTFLDNPTHVALHRLRTRVTPTRTQTRPTLPTRACKSGQTQHVRYPEWPQTDYRHGHRPCEVPPARAIHLRRFLTTVPTYAVQRSRPSFLSPNGEDNM